MGEYVRKLLFFVVLIGFSSNLLASKKPLVVASIRPLALIVQDLAGEHVETRTLLETAASPHDFSLTIGQALMLNDADALFWVGAEFETFLKKGVTTPVKLAMLDSAEEGHDEHEHHAGRHPWLSTESVAVYAELITAYLSQTLPQNSAEFAQRLQVFKQGLKKRREAISLSLRQYTNLQFAVYHDGYGEFVEEHGLALPLAITKVPHERVSAKRLNGLGGRMQEVSCVLSEVAEAGQAKRYANLFDKPLVTIDLLATESSLSSFDAYLVSLEEAFKRCFSLSLSNP